MAGGPWGEAIDRVLSRIRDTAGRVKDRFPHWADPETGQWTTTADGDWTPDLVYGDYVLQDIDKILITYGNESDEQIAEQQNSVTSLAIQASTGAIGG